MLGVKKSNFRVGVGGACEALLWEFREDLVVDSTSQSAEVPEAHVSVRALLIAANSLEEALSYARFHSPEFNVRSVTCRGLMLLVSGSPVD